MQFVEHVKIGKHVFPRYSHPVLRAKVKTDAYVQKQIERKLQDPRLHHVVDVVAGRLMEQGETGNVNEKAVTRFINEAFGELGDFFDDVNAADGVHAGWPSKRNTSGGHRGASPARGPPSAFCPFPVRPNNHLLSSTRRSRRAQHAERPFEASFLRRRDRKGPGGRGAPAALVGFSPHRLCRGRSSRNPSDFDHMSFPLAAMELPLVREEKGGHLPSLVSSRQPSTSTPPEPQENTSSLVYSMLPPHLEKYNAAQLGEMYVRGGEQRPMTLRGAELRLLSPKAFSLLDITMDGNSSAFHRRQKAVPSPMQRAQAQQAGKSVEPSESSLRRRVMAALSTGNKLSFADQKCLAVAGAARKHKWDKPAPTTTTTTTAPTTTTTTTAPPTTTTPTPEAGQSQIKEMELPRETTRSRLLISIMKDRPNVNPAET